MDRQQSLARLADSSHVWDVLIIGGGATGVGAAVDAASRGYSVALVEQSDFGKGTSSRSTKLVHGGVRYLQQGNVSLVREALRERSLLRRNAPHVVHPLAFVLPTYRWWAGTYYGTGLWMYDWLAGGGEFGKSRSLSRAETLEKLPTAKKKDLYGGVLYYDGQFDDARLLVNLAQTATEQGAALANYVEVTQLLKDAAGRVNGVIARDMETDADMEIRARVVINATGAFVDDVRRMDDGDVPQMIAPSQGIHLMLDKSFLPGEAALLVPSTPDGRVLFVIPWHGAVLAGTTDTPIENASLEPRPQEQEIDFVLETLAGYLENSPTRADIRSTFAGIRPLVKRGSGKNTAKLSRDHTIAVSASNLLTITGGKWTTYRYMAEDCVNRAAEIGGLPLRPCKTTKLRIHGYHQDSSQFGPLWYYGSDAAALTELMNSAAGLGEKLHDDLPITAGEVVWAARREMARTVDDVLARRSRALLLNARAATDVAPKVAALLAEESQFDETWQRGQVENFQKIAAGYVATP